MRYTVHEPVHAAGHLSVSTIALTRGQEEDFASWLSYQHFIFPHLTASYLAYTSLNHDKYDRRCEYSRRSPLPAIHGVYSI